MKGYEAPSVKRAFAILGAVSTSKNGLGTSEISRRLKMAKSTAHGMALALEEVGAVIRDPRTKRYKLGFTLLEIGRRAYSQIDLETVRANGYALDDEEYIMGVRAAAAPITGLGQLKSAVWVVGFKAGLDEKRMKTVAVETKKASEEISRRIRRRISA